MLRKVQSSLNTTMLKKIHPPINKNILIIQLTLNTTIKKGSLTPKQQHIKQLNNSPLSTPLNKTY